MTKYLKSIVLCATLTIMPGMIVIAQVQPPSVPVTDTNPPLPPMSERMKNWGPNDTIIVPAIWYQREIVNYKEMDMAWVSNLSPEKLAKFI
ncbi:MAG: hypothetical protein IPK57_13975 [Chitinophagaceae bacterium]|nr:hypothetical protein [Chitinophagaceae bacterium]